MKKINVLLYLLTMLTISFATISHGASEDTDTTNPTKYIYRGSSITLEELATVADLSTARDQKATQSPQKKKATKQALLQEVQ